MHMHDVIINGTRATFTYSLPEDSASEISARLFHRTGETVETLRLNDHDAWEGSTAAERMDEGVPLSYKVRFPDGHEDTAFEDELSPLTD